MTLGTINQEGLLEEVTKMHFKQKNQALAKRKTEVSITTKFKAKRKSSLVTKT